MGRFDGVLFCSDIDGTLAIAGKVSRENIDAVKYFQENGGRFTFCTGRYPDYTEHIKYGVIPNAPVVVLNGAMIYDVGKNEALYRCLIGGDYFSKIYDVLMRYPEFIGAELHSNCVSYRLKFYDGQLFANTTANPDVKVRVDSVDDYRAFVGDKTDVYKGIFLARDEDSDRLNKVVKREFPEYTVSRSWINGIEIQNRESDKGKGMLRLAKLLGDVDMTVSAGDYENDIPMITDADIGYAVGDAHENVKAVAKRVTVPCAENAIAKIIYEL